MKTLLLGISLAACSFGASWTGTISDSACGASHAKMLTEHKDLKTDHDCTLACVRGGGKYVLVSSGKVYTLANQTFADLERNAGGQVTLEGDMKGDTITVTKITKK